LNAVTEIKQSDKPLSEQFRIVARQFVDADAAARILEELKTTTLEQRKCDLQKKRLPEKCADNFLERTVKSSPEWEDYIREMCNARSKANKLKVHMEVLRMEFSEWQTKNANARQERRM